MGEIDLHMHSIYSDGSKSPTELVDMGKKMGLKVMALTDHDNIEGSKEFVKNNNKGVYLYSGVELTANVAKGRMHILGYNIDLNNEKLNRVLHDMKENSIYNFLLYVELLKRDFGLVLPHDEINLIVNSKGNIGRPQLALLLVKFGYCTSVDEAFEKYLISVYEKARKLKRGLTKEECVYLIKNAGGIVSLAHPVSLKMDRNELEEEIVYLKSIGLDSIEVIHSNNGMDDRNYFHYLSSKYNLLESGGSDFHGYEVKPDIGLGTGRENNININRDTLTLTKRIESRYMKR